MADTAVAITEGSGINIDTRTESTNGNHRQVMVIGDPTTNTSIAPVDATNGLSVTLTTALPAGTAAIGKLAANTGVDIGDVDVIGGGVADNAADSGNPVKVGGKYNSTPPTYANGDRADLQVDANGNLLVSKATLDAGEDTTNDVLKIEHRYSYSLVTRASLSVIKAEAGFVHSITVLNPSSPTMTIYDATSAVVPIVWQSNENLPVGTYLIDEVFATGITVNFSIASGILPRINFSYR